MFEDIRPLFSFLARRRAEPWNWLIQTAGLLLLLPALGMRSLSLAVLACGMVAGGLFQLPLPPMEYTGLHRLERGIRRMSWAERDFFSPPMNRKKALWLLFWLAYFALWGLALWIQDIGFALLLAGVAFLLKLHHDNRSAGIR